jgi:tetratricopeptide (TPR) repeat protein
MAVNGFRLVPLRCISTVRAVFRRFSLILLAVVTLLAASAQPLDVTNAPAVSAAPSTATNAPDNDALLRSVLILQEQLRSTQREVQQAREEAQTTSRHTAELLAARLDFIEKKQMATFENANQLMLKVVGIISVLACVAVILSGWVQMRAVAKLTDISHQLEMLPGLAASTGVRQIGTGEVVHPTPVVQTSTDNLSENIDRLQRRIDELEHTANGNITNGHKELPSAGSRVVSVIAKGQAHLIADQPEQALACFDEAITLDPRHTEAWLKKGAALEKLQRIDEAIAAYDKAIEVDQSTATAYLFKAGVFNRQKRYAEALQCYEKALHVQKSRTASAA